MATFYGSENHDILNGETGEWEGFTGNNSNVNDLMDDQGDHIEGRGGKDTITGGPGADRIYGGDGDDTLDPGRNRPQSQLIDTIYGGNGDDTITNDLTAYLYVYGGNGDDTIHGDDLFAGWLEGGAGADTMTGSGGFATLWLRYFESPSGVRIDLSTNLAKGGHAKGDVISGFSNVWGSEHADVLTASNDDSSSLRGGGGDDILYGKGGSNGLEGGDGNDILYGGGGDDFLSGGKGRDEIYGGKGSDTVSFREDGAGVRFSLAGGGSTGEIVKSVEQLDGSDFNDHLSGTGKSDTIRGNNGNDTIFGGGGDDNLVSGLGMNTLYGGGGDDFLYVNSRSSWQSGSTGHTVYGGAGDDRLAVNGQAAELDLQAGTVTITAFGGGTTDAVFFGIENVNLTSGDDVVHGSRGTDDISGAGGNDSINGRGGKDTLEGGSGDDVIAGGGGADFIEGGTGLDTLYGGGGNDSFIGDDGADMIFGGKGKDTYVVDFGFDALTVDLRKGKASGDKEVDGDSFKSIENVFLDYVSSSATTLIIGNNGANELTGSWSDDTIRGGGGKDHINGYSGQDVLAGGGGRDSFYFRSTTSEEHARITDMKSNERIGLERTVFEEIGRKLTADEFVVGGAAKNADHHVIYQKNTGLLWWDSDGTGEAEARVIADIGKGLKIDEGNFFLFDI